MKFFLAVKLLIFVTGALAYTLIPAEMTNRQVRANNILLDPWSQYDAAAYIDIAQNGYNDGFMSGRGNYAWFPLYPVLIKAFGFLGYYTAGFLISNIASVLAIAMLYALVKEELGKKRAYRSVFFISMFPTSYFFTALYTESLFLLLSLCTFVFAKRKLYLPAGISGFLLSLTRLQGFLVFFPVAYICLKHANFKITNIRRDAAFVMLIPLGLAALLLYHYIITGNAFIMFKTHSDFERQISLPWVSVINEISPILSPLNSSFQYTFVRVFNLFVLLLLSLLAYVSYKHLGKEYTIYILVNMIIFMVSGTLEAISRFSLVIFPVFMSMSVLEMKSRRAGKLMKAMYTVFFVLLVLFTVRHVNEEIYFDARDLIKLFLDRIKSI